MPNRAARQHQVDENYDAFVSLLPDILQAHAGKFALMHERNVVDYFDFFGDAVRFGNNNFTDGNFSIQEVSSGSASLGFYSYAVSPNSDQYRSSANS